MSEPQNVRRVASGIGARACALLVAIGLLVGGAAPLAGQQGPEEQEDPYPEDSGLHNLLPAEISKKTGPPGTEVTVNGTLLPPLTPVHVAIGGTRSGFEDLLFVLTDRDGNLSRTVEVPEWTTWDRTHLFIIFDMYFKPLAVSPIFHVTHEERGTIQREGRITRVGSRCTYLEGVDDGVYGLLGRTGEVAVDDSVTVEGSVVESSRCIDAIPLRVVSLQKKTPEVSRRD